MRKKNARRRTLSGVKTVDLSSSQLSHIQHDDEKQGTVYEAEM